MTNDQGGRATPSYVSFNDTERLIGDAAKSQVNTNPNNTVFDAKRLIGRRFDDKTVQEDMKHYPYKIIKRSEKPVIEEENIKVIKKFYNLKKFLQWYLDT